MKKILVLAFLFVTAIAVQAQVVVQKNDKQGTIIVKSPDDKDMLFANVEQWAHKNYQFVAEKTEIEPNGDVRNKESFLLENELYGLTIEFPAEGQLTYSFKDLSKLPYDKKKVIDDLSRAVITE